MANNPMQNPNSVYIKSDDAEREARQVKMWETEIIMHLQTLKTARNHPKANQKSIEQVEKAIEENLMKIRMIDPNYQLSHTEGNIEEEVHSGFDPKKKDVHTEDTLGISSKYSGEKKFQEENPNAIDMNEATKKFMDKLKAQEETAPNKEVDSETEALFEKLSAKASSEKSIDAVVDAIKKDTVFATDNIKSDVNVEYDLVPLPSNGECYKAKKKRLSVAYLTAYDENMITSPNLYEGNLISEFLLKKKILDKDINIMDLTEGDADAILLWLRKTGYGTDYPVSVRDAKTGKEFEGIVDLDKIKLKDFKLNGDENGLFDYHFDGCNADIKFRFLTIADRKAIDEKLRIETEDVRRNFVGTLIAKINQLVADDLTIDDGEKNILGKSMELITKWASTKSDDNYYFSNSITDSLERLIVSVNGNRNREYIKLFISKLPALDSLKFRKYVNENEPRVDFKVSIDRPADLGGGQIETFLKWDKYVFANTSIL